MAGTIGTNTSAYANVYNWYLTSYAPKSNSKYDMHRKDELKGVYKSIVKLNKESPLFLAIQNEDAREFAVGVKENARELHNTIASLGGLDEKELLNKKVAFSSNEEVLSVEYIGEAEGADDAPSFVMEVQRLASGQTNLGKFLPDEDVELSPGTYSFDIAIGDLSYEFQFNVNDGETNQDVQNRLSRLINNANIGLHSDILTNAQGSTSLRLASTTTGLPEGKDFLFAVSDKGSSRMAGSVEYLGLDFVSRIPDNACFLLDGEEYHSFSNEFTVEGCYRVHLKGASPDEQVQVGLKTDVDSLTQNISQLVGGYNSFIRNAAEMSGRLTNGPKLAWDMSRIARMYQGDLSNLGMDLQADGTIAINEDALKSTAQEVDAESHFDSIRDFTNSLLRKTNQVSLDPMQYVDKKVVAYKDPNEPHYATPYITSAYSGMMFNGYC